MKAHNQGNAGTAEKAVYMKLLLVVSFVLVFYASTRYDVYRDLVSMRCHQKKWHKLHHMKSNLIIAFILLLVLGCPPVAAAGSLCLEVLTGPAVNFPAPTRIKQSGFENINFNARFDTRPFELPIYYMIRASRWKQDRGWEVEVTHDKLYLTNNPPEVESFSITHGYNIISVNYAWRSRVLIYRVGGGMIISHPESTIRGEKFSESGGLFNKGYYLSGPVMATSVGGRFRLHDSVFISIESKLILSYAHVPIHDGSADLFISGLRLIAGVGMDLLK